MARTEVIRDVPEEAKKRIDDSFKAEGATVVWTKQANGKWTVTATFPDAAGAATAAEPPRAGAGNQTNGGHG
jgi:hypothetical protein